jgi:hypothetical protein
MTNTIETNPEIADSVQDQPRYATAADIMAIKAPEPIEEDYLDSETGLTYRIKGFEKIYEKISATRSAFEFSMSVKNGEITVWDSSGKVFTPTEEAVEAAVFASRCVREPQMGEMQWLATLDRTDLLYRLYLRIAHCNHDDIE